MKTVELVRQADMLKTLIKRVGCDPSTRALEMQAHWARYLCVLTAGFLENVVRDLFGAYVQRNSYRSAIVRYSKRQLERIQNPKAAKLVELAAAFDPAWGRDLEEFMADQYRSDAIDAIMSNRHLIAHGRSSSITVAQVSTYLSKIIEVAGYIEQQCDL